MEVMGSKRLVDQYSIMERRVAGREQADRIADLEVERDGLARRYDGLMEALLVEKARVKELEYENNRLREALEFWTKVFKNIIDGGYQKWEENVFQKLNEAYIKSKQAMKGGK